MPGGEKGEKLHQHGAQRSLCALPGTSRFVLALPLSEFCVLRESEREMGGKKGGGGRKEREGGKGKGEREKKKRRKV